jgi:hypothetical protein
MPRPARSAPAVSLTALGIAATLIAGCSSEEADAPASCLVPASEYRRALAAAPGEVRLEGTTPISDCLVADQDPAELGQIGEELIGAATRLNAAARRDPSGAATVQLGYLVGAVQQGASESAGVHTDLLRRLDAAARFNEGGAPLPASFERAFGRGYAAGQESG